MDIKYDYEGASIKVIENNKLENILYLSLKEENNAYSHYYNFFIENNENKEGTIYIKNMDKSPYYRKEIKNIPYTKIDTWNRLDNSYINEKNELVIKINPKTKQEISLSPRYVQQDLSDFIKKIDNSNMAVNTEPIDEIIIGNTKFPAIVLIARQHPGETLSSFFIEGVIKEILNSPEMIEKHCFIIYPIVNKNGVKNGDHRIINGIDYNRSWNKKDAPEEIKYIKEQLKKYKIDFFVDVHNDEITRKNYIRATFKPENEELSGIRVLRTTTKLRRFVRALIKQRKIINIFSKTANEYISKKYHCNTILIELSMVEGYDDIEKIGENFIKELIRGK